MQLAERRHGDRLHGSVAAALCAPLHHALGIPLPHPLHHSPRMHAAARSIMTEPPSLQWAVEILTGMPPSTAVAILRSAILPSMHAASCRPHGPPTSLSPSPPPTWLPHNLLTLPLPLQSLLVHASATARPGCKAMLLDLSIFPSMPAVPLLAPLLADCTALSLRPTRPATALPRPRTPPRKWITAPRCCVLRAESAHAGVCAARQRRGGGPRVGAAVCCAPTPPRTGRGRALACAIAGRQQLATLELRACRIGASAARALSSGLPQLAMLRTLRMLRVDMPAGGVEAVLCAAGALPRLTELDFVASAAHAGELCQTTAAAPFIVAITRMRCLKVLPTSPRRRGSLPTRQVRSDALRYTLGDCRPGRRPPPAGGRLRQLKPFAEAAAAYLPKAPRLQHLDLHLPLTPAIPAASASLLTAARMLCSATLRGLHLSAPGLTPFSEGRWQQGLVTRLALPGLSGTADGLRAFCAGLRRCRRLETLELPLGVSAHDGRWSGMHAHEAAAALGERLPCMTRLRRLDVSGWGLPPVGTQCDAVHMWVLGWHAGLTALLLTGTAIDDDWAKQLAGALYSMHGLKVLDLRRNRLSAAGVRPLLCALRKTNGLQELRLGGSLSDEAAVLELAAGLMELAPAPAASAALPVLLSSPVGTEADHGRVDKGASMHGSPTAASTPSDSSHTACASPVAPASDGGMHHLHASPLHAAAAGLPLLRVLDMCGAPVTRATVAEVWLRNACCVSCCGRSWPGTLCYT
eukprot:jgi/Ulvmu1/6486/UM003_0117.1